MALKYRRDTVVVNVPFLLSEPGRPSSTAAELGLEPGTQEPAPVERLEPTHGT